MRAVVLSWKRTNFCRVCAGYRFRCRSSCSWQRHKGRVGVSRSVQTPVSDKFDILFSGILMVSMAASFHVFSNLYSLVWHRPLLSAPKKSRSWQFKVCRDRSTKEGGQYTVVYRRGAADRCGAATRSRHTRRQRKDAGGNNQPRGEKPIASLENTAFPSYRRG